MIVERIIKFLTSNIVVMDMFSTGTVHKENCTIQWSKVSSTYTERQKKLGIFLSH